jgi:hypothetical protein
MHPFATARSTAVTLAVGVLTIAAAVLAVLVGSAPSAQAADLSRFSAGFIITDANFTNSSVMNAAQIQAFLNAKNPNCVAGPDGSPCLKNAHFDAPDRPADDRCKGYTADGNESAAQIIANVAVSCGISPQVIIVTLQKEEGLVTGSGSSLTATRYRSAMGYGCPDTAACDTKYYGFFNQVYQASWQFRSYALNPTRYSFRAGVVNQIQYSPNASCGSSGVLIQNQATASLYNYTPYQPNAAALASGYGSGDSCSSYGNRNFFSYFADWFGYPNGKDPIGSVDSVTASNTGITVTGWALDPDTSDRSMVAIYVDGAGVSVWADQPRADVDAVYHLGANHGFSTFVAANPGSHSVCTFSLSVGPGNNTLLDCRTVVVPDQAPFGAVDTITTTSTSATISGWSIDPDTSDRTMVSIFVDGVGTTIWADQARPDLAAYGKGTNHGYAYTLNLPLGTHTACVTAIDTVPGSNTVLACRTFTVENHAPVGVLDAVATTPTSATFTGWSIDPDTSDRTMAALYVDGSGVTIWADQPRTDVASYGKGDNHGFTWTMDLASGTHSVCAYGIDTQGGNNTLLGCRTFTVTNHAPIGALDTVAATPTSATITGWSIDPDTSDRTMAAVYVDGSGVTIWADQARTDLSAYGKGPNHGFTWTLNLPTGTHSVCAYGIDTTGGTNTLLGCQTFTVANHAPIGALDPVATTSTSATITGWSIDPDTSDRTMAAVYVDGSGVTIWADQARTDLAAYGKGANHGFTWTLNLGAGSHSVCVYGIDTAGGSNSLLGCRTFTVANHAPVGALDPVDATTTSATITGWSIDPDTSDRTMAAVYVDGSGVTIWADQPRGDVASYGKGNNHGFTWTLNLPAGNHSVCAYGIDTAGGDNTLLGCRSFTIGNHAPIGALDPVTTSGAATTIAGWSIDPDTSDRTMAAVYVDGSGVTIWADQSRPDLAVYNRGTNHGFTWTLNLPAGNHSVCAYGIDTAGGANTLLGCRAFTTS